MTEVLDRFDAMLQEFGFYAGSGDWATNKAFKIYAVPGYETWTSARRAIAQEQLTYAWIGIDVGAIDGLVGPQTAFAREAYQEWRETGKFPTWRDEEPEPVGTPIQLLFSNAWPKQSECSQFYGVPGSAVSVQLVRVRCPWPLRIAWDLSQTTNTISIHRKCADSLERILNTVYDTYGLAGLRDLGVDRYGGSYSHRKMRGGSSWSMHAYGCAIDWDPERNALKTKAPQARLSHDDALDWWRAWEEEGWLSLGRARNYDWMHVQAARL